MASLMTGRILDSSMSADTGDDPGRVDCPPMSKIRAPCRTASETCQFEFIKFDRLFTVGALKNGTLVDLIVGKKDATVAEAVWGDVENVHQPCRFSKLLNVIASHHKHLI